MIPSNKLILVSTFRHYFMSVGLAFSDPNSRYYLVFIDQAVEEKDNDVYMAAKTIGEPFAAIWYLPIRKKGSTKAKNRSACFSQLRNILKETNPTEIITGNDRRLEFQYAMHFSQSWFEHEVSGSFLDDGTGSYISFHNSKRIRYLSDKYLDTPLKKLVYGRWYSRPEVFGASDWVDRCYLTHPEVASEELKKKHLIELRNSYYLQESAIQYFKSLSSKLNSVAVETGGGKAVLFVLPHSSSIEDIYGSMSTLKDLLVKLADVFTNVYFKYHPRELGDPLLLNELGQALSANVPAELYCVINSFDLIIGDVSTALMAAKWLNPEADVRYFKTASRQAGLVADLFQYLEITPLIMEHN